VGPRVVPKAVKKNIPSSRRESNPRTPIAQPVAQGYTDWAITALKLVFYDEEIVPRATSKLEDHPLSTLRDCLFNIFAVTLHIWRPSPPSATRGRAMPWWQFTKTVDDRTEKYFKQKFHILIRPYFASCAHFCAMNHFTIKIEFNKYLSRSFRHDTYGWRDGGAGMTSLLSVHFMHIVQRTHKNWSFHITGRENKGVCDGSGMQHVYMRKRCTHDAGCKLQLGKVTCK
jgi:hypothetical protein